MVHVHRHSADPDLIPHLFNGLKGDLNSAVFLDRPGRDQGNRDRHIRHARTKSRLSDHPDSSPDQVAHPMEADSNCVRVSREHRLYAVPCNLGEVGIVYSGGAEMSDVAVAALVGADVQARGLLGRLPDISVEVPLAHIRPPGVVKISSQSGPFRLIWTPSIQAGVAQTDYP